MTDSPATRARRHRNKKRGGPPRPYAATHRPPRVQVSPTQRAMLARLASYTEAAPYATTDGNEKRTLRALSGKGFVVATAEGDVLRAWLLPADQHPVSLHAALIPADVARDNAHRELADQHRIPVELATKWCRAWADSPESEEMGLIEWTVRRALGPMSAPTGPQIDRLLEAADDHGQFLADNEEHADLAVLNRAVDWLLAHRGKGRAT